MKTSGDPLVVDCRDLSCGYLGVPVITKVNLKLEKGQIRALLGPNGCGKSTFLKTLSKSVPAIHGTAEILGHDLHRLGYAELARYMAYVPQEEHMAFRFTVRQLVLMGRMPYSEGLLDTAEDLQATEDAIERSGCRTIADRLVTELSGGEKQRALLARALAQDTPLLLMDEPTSHMDIGHQLAAASLLQNLVGGGKSVLAAIHDLNLASVLAHEASLISDGRVVKEGPIREVLLDPILDEVYGVRFHRFDDDFGTLRLFPMARKKDGPGN